MRKRLLFFVYACLLLFQGAFAVQNATKAVVFDFAGVIARFDRERMMTFLTQSFQVSEEKLLPIIHEWKKVLVSGEGDGKALWQEFAVLHGKLLSESWFDDFEKACAFTDIPGMRALVKGLQDKGYQTPLLSNALKWQADGIRKLKYYRLFDPVFLSYEIGCEKPQRQAYQILVDRLHLSVSELIFIDDQLENVEAARKFGIDSIHFTTIQRLTNELKMRGIEIK